MLDVKIFEPSRVLNQPELEVYKVDFDWINFLKNFPNGVKHEITYQFRYTVHRQFVGFFTPVVFDVKFEYVELQGPHDVATISTMNRYAEAFIEGALCVNHESHFFVHLLKGAEAGLDRRREEKRITETVNSTDNIWYSDWETPPITQQNQRVIVYDLDVFGSMLEPRNVVTQFINLVHKRMNNVILRADIVSGYTQKVV